MSPDRCTLTQAQSASTRCGAAPTRQPDPVLLHVLRRFPGPTCESCCLLHLSTGRHSAQECGKSPHGLLLHFSKSVPPRSLTCSSHPKRWCEDSVAPELYTGPSRSPKHGLGPWPNDTGQGLLFRRARACASTLGAVVAGLHFVRSAVPRTGSRRKHTQGLGYKVMYLYRGPKNGQNDLKCSNYAHDAAQAIFEIAHQHVVGGRHFTTFLQPDLSERVDAEFVGKSLADGRIGVNRWNSARRGGRRVAGSAAFLFGVLTVSLNFLRPQGGTGLYTNRADLWRVSSEM